MACLKHYKWDVFVSYRHRQLELDNKDSEGRTWIKRVVRKLESMLTSSLRREVEFFLGVDDLERDRDLTEGLLKEVDQA